MKEYGYWVRKSYRYLLVSLGWRVKKDDIIGCQREEGKTPY